MIWTNIFRAIILIMGIAVLAFNARLYVLCKQQRIEINTISDQQRIEAQVDNNKFKYQQDQIEDIGRDLEDAQQQIKNQHDESKNIQTSLVDIEAEADAIKQSMKGWQKDYVNVLAQIEKKMEGYQLEIKNVNDNINALKADIEKITLPQPPVKDKSENQP